VDILELIRVAIDAGGTVALAAFAIIMLRQLYRERGEDAKVDRELRREDRQRLLDVIDRNTGAWGQTTQSLTEMTNAMAAAIVSLNVSERDIADIRLLLAKRPCVGDAIMTGAAKPRGKRPEPPAPSAEGRL
jgi:hypothetical protein